MGSAASRALVREIITDAREVYGRGKFEEIVQKRKNVSSHISALHAEKRLMDEHMKKQTLGLTKDLKGLQSELDKLKANAEKIDEMKTTDNSKDLEYIHDLAKKVDDINFPDSKKSKK
uniref:Uncharacterized protein n=1 Tax=Corethron hystrix TaxID=216773 RepID=A0A6U5GNW5_9STRA|mmetsp:Transcript_27363/g.62814  ORF Transcript_27363/g.62814 Transcript_27363/m.62814 type:complete len:118 (+) Transcript_27363:510-863(+)